MKVLMLGWEYPPAVNGGLGVACRGLAEALARIVQVRVVVPGEGGADGGADCLGVALAGYEGSWGLYGGDLWGRVAAYGEAVVGLCGDGGFDVVHAHDWMTMAAGVALRERTGVPLVVHVHSLEFDRSGSQRGDVFEVERAGMLAADVVVAVSRYTAGVCERVYGIERGKIVVVHNGVDAGEFDGALAAGDRVGVLGVGRVTRQKGPGMFARLAARFPGERFAWVGDGDLSDELVGVEAVGFLDREALVERLRRAAVFWMPSVSEPFGIAALEAAICGVPVLVSRQAGVREVLPSAVAVDAWDEVGWAVQLGRLLGDVEARRALGEAVRREARACTWERAAAQVLGIYQGL